MENGGKQNTVIPTRKIQTVTVTQVQWFTKRWNTAQPLQKNENDVNDVKLLQEEHQWHLR